MYNILLYWYLIITCTGSDASISISLSIAIFNSQYGRYVPKKVGHVHRVSLNDAHVRSTDSIK